MPRGVAADAVRAALDAQRALFSAEQALVQLRRAHMSSTVNLYKALGGSQPG